MILSTHTSIINILKGGQSWCREPSPPYFLLLGDDILVLWANVSPIVLGTRAQAGSCGPRCSVWTLLPFGWFRSCGSSGANYFLLGVSGLVPISTVFVLVSLLQRRLVFVCLGTKTTFVQRGQA